jgi:hypothetical protein
MTAPRRPATVRSASAPSAARPSRPPAGSADQPPVLLASSARQDLALPRSCGGSSDDCIIQVVGSSDDVCERGSPAFGRRLCHDLDGAPWTQAITVYLGLTTDE